MSAYLIVLFLASTSGNWQIMPYPFPGGMDACNKAVASGKTDLAKGGDAEAAIAMFCSESEWPNTYRNAHNWDITPYKKAKP